MLSFEIPVQPYWTAFNNLEKYRKMESHDFDSHERQMKAVKLKCFLLQWINRVKEFPCRNNILGEIKKCLNSVFEISFEDFFQAFDYKLYKWGD